MSVKGGQKFTKILAEIGAKVSQPRSVRVGFLAGATYPGGKSVAMIAAIHNFGAPRAGIPPRPFFSNMIAAKSAEWPAAIGDLLVANGYDVERTLDQVGFAVAGQLRQSIQETNSPPLADSTVARKGFDKPLIETGHMFNSVDHEVVSR